MRRRLLLSCLPLLLLPAALSADVTLIYRTELKLNPDLPAAFGDAMKPALGAMAGMGRTILIHGGKSCSSVGTLTVIGDPRGGRIVLVNSATQRFADIPASQFMDEATRSLRQPEMPSAMTAAMSSMKISSDARLTGRTEQIQGVQAEEHEITMSVSGPAGPATAGGALVKIVMQIWTAKPEEVARNAAIREYVDSGIQTMAGMDPTEGVRKMLGQFPGLADGASSFMNEVASLHSVTLRVRSQVFMPMVAALGAGKMDPNSPLMEISNELVELSTAPVADSMFKVPDGYTTAPASELMAGLLPNAAPAPVANSVSQPQLISKMDPEYTEEARNNKVEGSVSLSVRIDTDGKARDMKVTRSLDPGLDQKAIEAVGRWVFKPGTKNGVAVATSAVVEVNFRLLAKPN